MACETGGENGVPFCYVIHSNRNNPASQAGLLADAGVVAELCSDYPTGKVYLAQPGGAPLLPADAQLECWISLFRCPGDSLPICNRHVQFV
eukprot:3279222-Pleurochrysis_carterae.AAC.2